MSDDLEKEIQKKVASLDERIKDARRDEKEYKTQQYGVPAEESEESKRGKRAASVFLGNVIAGGILGFFIDKYCSSAPLAMIFFIIMGFVSGVYRANAITKKNE
tara:strand:- start:1530 stop:1841 length:312 start_codon:yes stop_codon:yes gene_type:complete